jgi:hypothetical protein
VAPPVLMSGMLLDVVQEEVLKQYSQKLKHSREKMQACATPQERLAIFKSQNVKMKEQRKQGVGLFLAGM